MRRALRWAAIGLGGVLALLVVAALAVFGLSEMALRKEHRAAAETLAAPTPAQTADAGRQARIAGCVTCHGEGLGGKVMFDAPGVARVYAPNLTEVAAKASDQQLAAAIRQGIGHDGRALFVMPSPEYSHMTDHEVAALIAWIRAQPRVQRPSEPIRLGPLGRLGIALGSFPPAPQMVEEFRRVVPIDLGPSHAAARHIVMTNCTECHGPALFGQEMPSGDKPPDLTVAAGYDPAQFRTLMRRGVTPAGKKLGLMREVAVSDFSHLTDAELDAIHAYLVARAKRLGGT